MKRFLMLFVMIPVLLALSCSKEPVSDLIPADSGAALESASLKVAIRSRVDVVNPILNQVTGKSTLIRNKNGITMTYNTSGLTPGHTYTIWWLIWNNPENCAVPGACQDPDLVNAEAVGAQALYATGGVAGPSGKRNFAAHLKTGDLSGNINDLFGLPPGLGLQKGKSYSAEVHLLLRSHGPKIPGQVKEQISTFGGGCTDPFAFPPFSEIPDAVGECGEIEFAIHPPAKCDKNG